MQALCWTVVMEKELSHKVELLIYRSVNIPTLTSGHELWVVTARTRLWIQVAEMRFLQKVAVISLRDRVGSSDIEREFGVELLLRGI